jgi:hypothetical protein
MSTGFKGPIVFGPEVNSKLYPYRAGKGMIPSAEWIVFFDDFTGDVASNVPEGWDAAIIDTGCTNTNANLAGGVLLMDSDADNEGTAIYQNKHIALAGKRFFMECRVKMEDVSAMTFQMGISDLTATTNPEDIWTTTTTDYISFGNLDTDEAVLTYDKNNGGTVTETNSNSTQATLADDTYAILAIDYNGGASPGDSSVRAYVNGIQVAAAGTEAQIPDDLPLAPFIGFLAGHATTADVVHVDYVRYSLER